MAGAPKQSSPTRRRLRLVVLGIAGGGLLGALFGGLVDPSATVLGAIIGAALGGLLGFVWQGP
jgi:hypothetical protein